MARSRYAGNPVIDGNHFASWRDPTAESFLGPGLLDGVPCVDHTLKGGERLDILAARYYGDDEYWWVIALANRIQTPFGLTVGTKLRIPLDPKSIVSKVQR